MPALVSYVGDDELRTGSSFYSGDSGIMLSIGSNMVIYSPPRKRSRISGPLILEGRIFEQKKPSIDILPDECLFEIFRRLEGGQERMASACVSKRWLMLLSSIRCSELSQSKIAEGNLSAMDTDQASIDIKSIAADEDLEVVCDGCLTRCVEGKKATDVRLAAISVGTSSRGGLGKLSIRGSNSLCGATDIGLSAIACGCPSLKVLSLWNVPSIGDEGLVEIARECHFLEKLDLSQCPLISNKGVVAIAKNCPNLNALAIESCPNIGDESLHAIGKYCPMLKSISIKDCSYVTDQGIASLLSSATSRLTRLKLQSLNITDCALAVIGHYGKAITNLILYGLQNVSEKGFWVMGNAQGLRTLSSLKISSCRGVTDLSYEAVSKGSPNLKQMCLSKCCFVSDKGLVAFAKAACSLESLQLEECNRITQTGILNAISNFNQLKSLSLVKCMGIKDLSPETPLLSPCESLRCLSIRSCPGFGSASLAMLGELCPQLHHLDLSGLSGITDASLCPLLESCEAGLAKVNLSDCFNLTDEVVMALARLHGETLELINLDGCSKITDASLVALADNCRFLNDLDVTNCSITDSGIAALSRGMQPSLQVLSLSGCSMISNKCMPYLKKLGRTLLGLNLQHCKSLSSSTLEQLTETLWRCDILA